MDISLQYKVFDWLRFPLIVGVVFIHSFGAPFDISSLDIYHMDDIDYFNIFRVSISHVLTHVCVPVFFLISGYLFFRGLEKWDFAVYTQKLKRRFKTLLVPYLIWNTVSILLSLFFIFHKDGFEGVSDFFNNKNIYQLYWDFHTWNTDRVNWLGLLHPDTSPYCPPLWFLRDLMVVCVFSPLLWIIFNSRMALGGGIIFVVVLC